MSLDTSTTSSGWSIYTNGKLKDYGVVDLSKVKGTAKNKIPIMISEIEKIIEKYKPSIVVVELTVVSRNAQAQRNLTMLLGMIWHICINKDIEFVDLRPTEWRSYVSADKKGRTRNELKDWSIKKVEDLFGIKEISDDVSDAILIGYGYIEHCKEWS